MNYSLAGHDAADLGGCFCRKVGDVEVLVAPRNCIGAAEYEKAVGSSELFGECAGIVDLIEVLGYANEFCGLKLWPIGKDRDEKDAVVLLHTSIL